MTYSTPQPDPVTGFAVWPEDWPQYKQSCYLSWEDRCDMLIGHCVCGSYHMPGEFMVSDRGEIYRHGTVVSPYNQRPINNGEKLESYREKNRKVLQY